MLFHDKLCFFSHDNVSWSVWTANIVVLKQITFVEWSRCVQSSFQVGFFEYKRTCPCSGCIWGSADLCISSRERVTVWLLDSYIKKYVNFFEIFQFSCEPHVCSHWLAGQSLLCFFSLPRWNLFAVILNTEEFLMFLFYSERIILLQHI